MTPRFLRSAGLILWLWFATSAVATELVVESQFFVVSIDGHLTRLEGLTVKRADLPGRLPIAVITHGRSGNRIERQDMRASDYLVQASDLAQRGWLSVVIIRRGYGLSDGPEPSPPACPTNLMERFSGSASDIAATLEILGHRSDADSSRIIAIGGSAGGGAVIALASRQLPGLKAIFNLGGGPSYQAPFCQAETEAYGLEALRTFYSTIKIPSLWVFARNDSHASVEQIARQHVAARSAGAPVKLVLINPIGDDGHNLLGMAQGRVRWLKEMDLVLKELDMPTWSAAEVDDVVARMPSARDRREYFESYVSAPSNKVLAFSKSKGVSVQGNGWLSLERARDRVLRACQRSAPDCQIVMENHKWVGSR